MKKKDIILISIITVLTIIIIFLVVHILTTKNTTNTTIEGEVLAKRNDYILLTTDDSTDYIINTKDTDYSEGDKIKVETKKVSKNKSPIEVTPEKITIIEKKENTKIEDNQKDKITVPTENTQDNQTTTEENNQNNQTSNNTQTIQSTTEENYSEDDVVNYFNDLDNNLTTYSDNDETLKNKIKTNFVKCIDFIFYGKEIGGKTFAELSNNAKIKILKIAFSIDSKIDSKIPGYKDTISSAYHNIKSKLVEKYLETTTKICESDQELCKNAKAGFQDLKTNFGITWDIIKSIAGKGTTKLKNWYEIWRYK